MSVRSTRTGGQVGRDSPVDLRRAIPGRRDTGSSSSSTSAGTATVAGRGVGSPAKFAELRRDLPQQPHLPQDRRHALVEQRPERPAPILVHALQVLGRQLNRRQRILDLVRDLPRHLGPRLELIRARQLRALRAQRRRHAVEVVDQPPQFVSRVGDDAHVELPGGDLPRGARQPRHRIRNAAGDRRAEARGKQDDEDRADEHAAIELVDLLLDLALAQRERHAQHRLAPACRNRRRRHADTGTCRVGPARRTSAAARARSRGRQPPASASAAGRSRTDRAGWSPRAASLRTGSRPGRSPGRSRPSRRR